MFTDPSTDKFMRLDESLVLKKALVNMPLGTMLVDRDMTLCFANRILIESLLLPPDGCADVPISSVFRCRSLCGRASKCQKCAVRKMLSDIFEGESPPSGAHFKLSGDRRMKWFKINGTKLSFEGRDYAFLTFDDITPLKEREALLQRKLRLDMATATLNKYGLIEVINKLTKPEKIRSFAICMTDFDDFKSINDCYGHLTGDRVLNTFSEIARKVIRSKDILGRYGGEEFIFLFMDTDLESAVSIVRRIQKELSQHFEGVLIQPVTFSAGLLHFGEEPDNKLEYAFIIDEVDKLLYKAKQHGKNCIVSSPSALFKA